MTIEIGLLFGAIACAIGIAAFFGGKQSAAKTDGQAWGEIKTDVKYIRDGMGEIKAEVRVMREQYSDIHTDVEVVKRDLKTAFNRIDEVRKG